MTRIRRWTTRAGWCGAWLLAIASASVFSVAALAPTVWGRAADGSLIGARMDSWRWAMARPDPKPRLDGWTRTYSRARSYSIDEEEVAAVLSDRSGRVVGCAVYVINTDVPERHDVLAKASFGTRPEIPEE